MRSFVVQVGILFVIASCTQRSTESLSPTAVTAPGCYRFEFKSWRSERPGFQLDTMPRIFRLTDRRVAPSMSGTPHFRASLVRGSRFGDYAPAVQPIWNRITGDSAGFAVSIHDIFS